MYISKFVSTTEPPVDRNREAIPLCTTWINGEEQTLIFEKLYIHIAHEIVILRAKILLQEL